MCCLTCEGAIGKGSTEREEPNKVQLLLTFMAFSHVYYRYKERIESHFQLNDSRRMWQGLRTICAFGNKSSAEVRADPLLADELNTFYGRFECNGGSAALPSSASGSSRQRSENHLITVSEDEVRRALKRVNVRKTAGPDGITEVLR